MIIALSLVVSRLASQSGKRSVPSSLLEKLPESRVIPPFLRGLGRRIYAAILSFWAGVIPPLPMFGRSLL